MSEQRQDDPARDATIVVRVRPGAKQALAEIATRKGIRLSAAVREALRDWVAKNRDAS